MNVKVSIPLPAVSDRLFDSDITDKSGLPNAATTPNPAGESDPGLESANDQLGRIVHDVKQEHVFGFKEPYKK